MSERQEDIAHHLQEAVHQEDGLRQRLSSANAIQRPRVAAGYLAAVQRRVAIEQEAFDAFDLRRVHWQTAVAEVMREAE